MLGVDGAKPHLISFPQQQLTTHHEYISRQRSIVKLPNLTQYLLPPLAMTSSTASAARSTPSAVRTREQLTSDFKDVDGLPEGGEDNVDKPALAHLLLQEMSHASTEQGRKFTKGSVDKLCSMWGATNLSEVDGVGNINISDDGEAIDG
jgi:hypothetical protein